MKVNWQSKIETLYKSKSSKICHKLQAANINTLLELISILPRRVSKIQSRLDSEASIDQYIHLSVKVISAINSPGKLNRKKIPLSNITLNAQDLETKKIIQLKWFNAYPSLTSTVTKADYLQIFGKISQFNGQLQIINPEIKLNSTPEKNLREYPTLNSVPGTKIKNLIDKIPKDLWKSIPSVVPESIKLDIELQEAYQVIHHESNFELRQLAIKRLIYEELYNEQIQIDARRNNRLTIKTEKFTIDPKLSVNQFQQELPFNLTKCQVNALESILTDLTTEVPMMRLLQGDVGCGKTLVAFGAAYTLMKQDAQVALMCPTEVLAQQHFKSALTIFDSSRVGLLTSSTKRKEKLEIQQAIKDGKILFVIGTHSLIQESLSFKSLSLSIIDEQHKFGVNQRISLTKKANSSNTLLMTATPIPRSLCLTQFGDLDISIIKEKPQGRKKVSSRIIGSDNFQNFLNFINTRVDMGEQVYVVAPAIEESEILDIQNVQKITAFFKKNFPRMNIQALHGKLSPQEKEQILNNFYHQETNVLISTSVIEVGIDNHNATVMCIFGPERFGLSSLHQLRGRVGRGGKPGFFFMVEDKKLTGQSIKRLQVIENCMDGFKIAEEDLKLRGEGNLIGTEQSGANLKKLSDISAHKDILEKVISDFKTASKQSNLFNHAKIKEEVIYTI